MKRKWIYSSWSFENFGKCDISSASSKQDRSNLQGSLQAQQYKSWGYLLLWFKWGPSCGGGWIPPRLWLRHHRSLSLPSRASVQCSDLRRPRSTSHRVSCLQPPTFTLVWVEINLISWGAFKVTLQWTIVYPIHPRVIMYNGNVLLSTIIRMVRPAMTGHTRSWSG